MPTAQSGAERKSFGELLSQLSIDSAALLRDELELAKQEMREKVKTLQIGLVLIIIGGMILQVAVIGLSAAAAIKLADHISLGASSFLIGAGLALTGTIVAMAGLRQIKHTSLKPEKTIQTLKEGKEWLKQMA